MPWPSERPACRREMAISMMAKELVLAARAEATQQHAAYILRCKQGGAALTCAVMKRWCRLELAVAIHTWHCFAVESQVSKGWDTSMDCGVQG